ncbi:MAG: hypothetical protein CMB80_25985 [Flammeovirgaceae bacterium]|nr:hypothetical protein [Flammeovirgaceae bacterium]
MPKRIDISEYLDEFENDHGFRPQGKLGFLVNAFHEASEQNDVTEIVALMSLLEDHKWDTDKLKLQFMLEDHYDIEFDDLMIFEKIKEQALASMPTPILSEDEKLDRVVEMAKSPMVNYDYDQVKAIASALKVNDPSL